MRKLIVFTGIVLFCTTAVLAQKLKFPLSNAEDSASYSLGLNIATQMQNQGVKVNPDLVAKAIADMQSGNDPLILPTEANNYINEYVQGARARIAKENQITSDKWLAENKKKPGVKTLPSGLQYEIIQEGTGVEPKKGDMVTAHYTGTLTDGTVFDSSVKRGQPFQTPVGVGRVIKGWDEALLLMKPGAKWKLTIPPDLGYGANPRPGSGIKPNDVLIFELELISFEATPPANGAPLAPGGNK